MNRSAADTSRVGISRLRMNYLVSSDHPSPHLVRESLDEAVTQSLPRVIDSLLKPLCPPTDERMWLIRGVHLDLGVNVTWDADQVTRAVGESLAHQLVKTIQAEGDGETTLCFQNRAAYLAQFLLDCAKGWAWGQWYYEAFEGLRPLPTSAAIRTAVLDDSATGLVALQSLAPADLSQVLSALDEQDARWLIEGLVQNGPVCDDESAMRATWESWQRCRDEQGAQLHGWKTVLRLCLEVNRNDSAMVGPTHLQAAQAVVGCWQLMKESAHPETIALALKSGRLATLYQTVGAADGERLAPFLRCSEAWVNEVMEVLCGSEAPASKATQEQGMLRETAFGGLFLLLPLLNTFPWEEGAEGWPECHGVPASTVLRLLVFAKCCGGGRAEEVIRDPLVRDLFGIPPVWSASALVKWRQHVQPQQVIGWQQVTAAWLSEQASEKQTYVLKSLRVKGSRRFALLVEAVSGQWVWTEILNEQTRPALSQWLSDQSERGRFTNAVLFYDRRLKQFIEGLRGWQELVSIGSARAQDLMQEDEQLTKTVCDTAMLQEEGQYLVLPKAFGLTPTLDFALSVTAQRVLRAFAQRLPGFGGSGFEYLYRQFLDCTATMEEEAVRRVVRLGDIPLRLIVNMAGLSRSTCAPSWLDGRPIMVFPCEGDD